MQQPRNLHRLSSILFYVFCALCFLKVLVHAWVAEDAFITFRVVDNVVHGYGLRWNPDERVQVYTHPLWMLLHIPFYVIYNNIYRLTIILSAVCGLGAVTVILASAKAPLWQKAVLVVLPLTLSYSFDNFVICGLENPLSFLLLALAAYKWLKPRVRIHRLIFVVALCILTRFDNVMIVLPMLAWGVWQCRRELRVGKLMVAVSPLALWCLFSLWYYGFLFPNTKYAKLNTGISESAYLTQGWHYLCLFPLYDFLGAMLIVAAVVTGIYCLVKAKRLRAPMGTDAKLATLALGCLLHIGYAVYVGGDFMDGRFFVNAVVVSVIVLYVAWHHLTSTKCIAAFSAVIAASAAGSYVLSPLIENPSDIDANYGVVDERLFYINSTSIISDPQHIIRESVTGAPIPFYSNPFTVQKLTITGQHEDMWDGSTLEGYSVGLLGFYVGPRVKIIDELALCDPLLARLPIPDPDNWRIGHFRRTVPPGYYEARRTGDISGMDANLAKYYEKLRLVISGNLWDPERMKAIIGFQTGAYDGFLKDYLAAREVP